MYKYETHLHTSPVSRCATATVRETLEYYKSIGYDGVFITNHFLDGNINLDGEMSYEEKINFYCSDYEEGKKIGKELGLKVFFGVESSYKGTDFLIYGLDKKWYLKHPEIMDMKKSAQLKFMAEEGAFIIHAHPFREAGYIDHIRLFPYYVHGAEIINACRTPAENDRAKVYADWYNLLYFAGSDNHSAAKKTTLAGMESPTPVKNEKDFIKKCKQEELKPFYLEV